MSSHPQSFLNVCPVDSNVRSGLRSLMEQVRWPHASKYEYRELRSTTSCRNSVLGTLPDPRRPRKCSKSRWGLLVFGKGRSARLGKCQRPGDSWPRVFVLVVPSAWNPLPHLSIGLLLTAFKSFLKSYGVSRPSLDSLPLLHILLCFIFILVFTTNMLHLLFILLAVFPTRKYV